MNINQRLFKAITDALPPQQLMEIFDDSIELTGDGGLRLSIIFDFNPDLSHNYEQFSCAPFMVLPDGTRSMGHNNNWPLDDFYTQVTPNELRAIVEKLNTVKV